MKTLFFKVKLGQVTLHKLNSKILLPLILKNDLNQIRQETTFKLNSRRDYWFWSRYSITSCTFQWIDGSLLDGTWTQCSILGTWSIWSRCSTTIVENWYRTCLNMLMDTPRTCFNPSQTWRFKQSVVSLCWHLLFQSQIRDFFIVNVLLS